MAELPSARPKATQLPTKNVEPATEEEDEKSAKDKKAAKRARK